MSERFKHPIFYPTQLVIAALILSSACSPKAQPAMELPTVAMPTSVGMPTATPTEAELPDAGRACEGAQNAAVGEGALSAPVLIGIKHADGDQWVIKNNDLPPELTSLNLSEIGTLVCIRETLRIVGCYTSSGQETQCNLTDPPAYKVHWDVRALKWPDGDVIGEIEFTGGDPPKTSPGGPGYGDDPVDPFRSWLSDRLNQSANQTIDATPTNTVRPIPSSTSPSARTTYSGRIDEGSITFTVAPGGSSIEGFNIDIPGKVACAEGGTASGIKLDFDNSAPIKGNSFEFANEAASFRGSFDTPTSASGSFEMKLGSGPGACTIGPLAWTADVSTTMETPIASLVPKATETPIPSPAPTATPTLNAQIGTAPVIQSVDLREDTSSGSLVIFQDITYRDADGDADIVHYEIIHATEAGLEVMDGTIDASIEQQQNGTTITGQWNCGGGNYEATLRVTILDRAGNVSNSVDYTLKCR